MTNETLPQVQFLSRHLSKHWELTQIIGKRGDYRPPEIVTRRISPSTRIEIVIAAIEAPRMLDLESWKIQNKKRL